MIQRIFVAVLIFAAVLLNSNAFSDEPLKSSEAGMIESEEYEIFNIVLEEYHALVLIERTTMSEKTLDNAVITHLKRSGVHVDDYLADDFNKKNSRSYELEKRFTKKRYFMDESHRGFQGSSKESVKISRPGFNKERNRALIFVSYKSIAPQKAFYEEGNFVYLEKKDGKWISIKTVMASQRYY
jgi:hypothetical protein